MENDQFELSIELHLELNDVYTKIKKKVCFMIWFVYFVLIVMICGGLYGRLIVCNLPHNKRSKGVVALKMIYSLFIIMPVFWIFFLV